MRPEAHTLEVPDAAAAWSALGFRVTDGVCDVGDVRVALERPWGVVTDRGIEGAPDALPLSSAPRTERPAAPAHPNGASAIDHVVALTDLLDRTVSALEASGLECRRRTGHQAFFNLSTLILEVVQAETLAPRIWGLTVVADPLPEGPHLGTAKDAVQPGRRIVTVRPSAGLSGAMAFITPRVRTRRET